MADERSTVANPEPSPSRRQFIAGAAGVAAATALGSIPEAAANVARPNALPEPTKSGIDRIVVLMMENRSFDHYLGWLPGTTGRQAGLSYPDKNGALHDTHHLHIFQSCGYQDPDHSYQGGRTQLADGKCNGWLLTGTGDTFPIGYYKQKDLAFFGHAAPHWTVCDNYFAATMGPTYPNRFYQHSAQTDRQDNTLTTSEMPTIWDRLAEAGVSHKYYYSDTPFTALWGSKYTSISQPYSAFTAAAAAGQLPAVCFVDPRFLGEGQGTSGDDHPLADIRVGQKFISDVYTALVKGPDWHRTLLIVNYDEWGGFFDTVKPHKAPDKNPHNALRGFRVPCLIMGPRTKRHHIAHEVFDHTSVLKLIEWRYGLKPLTPRDKAANNLASVLDFSGKPDEHAPLWEVPAPATPQPCNSSSSATLRVEHNLEWVRVKEKAAKHGFAV